MLDDLFYADDSLRRDLEFTSHRHLLLHDVSRHVQPRSASHADRRKLQKLPVFLYNSAPENSVLDEFKDKVPMSFILFIPYTVQLQREKQQKIELRMLVKREYNTPNVLVPSIAEFEHD